MTDNRFRQLAEVTKVRSLENNVFKTKRRTIYANFLNVTQNLFRL